MPAVKVANPAGTLLLVNPGGRKMRKRKVSHTTRRRKANPHSKRRVTVRVNGRHHRKHHAVARRRRRNPSILAGTGVVKAAITASVGGLTTQFVRNLIPIQFGGAFGDAGITAGVAWLLGLAAGKFLGAETGKWVAVGGVTVAATNLLQSFNLTPQALLSPAPKQVGGKGVGDIVALRGGQSDPYYGRTGGLPAGMRDIVGVAPSPAY